MKTDLDDLNHQEWRTEFEIFLRTKNLSKQVKYASFEDWFATIPKSKLELAYIEELNSAVGANEDETKEAKRKVKLEWKKEVRQFLKEEDNLMKEWRKDDEAAKGYIEQSIQKNFYNDIKDKESAYEMWEILEEKGRKHKVIHSFSNYQKFTLLKFKDDCSLAEFVNQHQELVDKLALTKCAVSPYQAAMKVLISLPNDYSNLVQSLIQEEDLSLSYIKERLMKEDVRENTVKMMKEEEMIIIKKEEANNAYKAEKKGPKCTTCEKGYVSPKAPKGSNTCYNCFLKRRKRVKRKPKRIIRARERNQIQREKIKIIIARAQKMLFNHALSKSKKERKKKKLSPTTLRKKEQVKRRIPGT